MCGCFTNKMDVGGNRRPLSADDERAAMRASVEPAPALTLTDRRVLCVLIAPADLSPEQRPLYNNMREGIEKNF